MRVYPTNNNYDLSYTELKLKVLKFNVDNSFEQKIDISYGDVIGGGFANIMCSSSLIYEEDHNFFVDIEAMNEEHTLYRFLKINKIEYYYSILDGYMLLMNHPISYVDSHIFCIL